MLKRLLVLGFGVGLLIATAHVVVLTEFRNPAAALIGSRDPKDISDNLELVTVVVPRREIPANQDLTPLIERGVFVEIEIPRAALVEGAVTDVMQMEGAITTVEILKHEQISTGRLTSNCCIDRLDPPAP